jgi:hypothetical protein
MWTLYRRLVLLASLLLVAQLLLGQEEEDRSPWSIRLAGGASIPALKAERSQGNARDLAGDPRTGPLVITAAEYELLPWLVGTMQANYARMAANDLTTAELFPPCIGCGLGGGTSRTGYSQGQGAWAMAQILGGLGLLGAYGRFSFTLHVEGGAQWTERPRVEVNEHGAIWNLDNPFYGTYSTRTVQPAAASWTLVGGGGIDLGFALSPRLGLRLESALRTTTTRLPFKREESTETHMNGESGSSTHANSTTPAESPPAIG